MEDTILSANLELKKELVESIKAEFKEAKSLITLRGNFLKSASTNLTNLMIYNLTRIP